MTGLTVIYILTPDDTHTETTMKSLVTQSSDDFNVLILDTGAPEASREICLECESEYVGFEYRKSEAGSVYEAMNEGALSVLTEYLSFILDGDELAPESVEKLYGHIAAQELKPDIITGREWRHGDIEYDYDPWLDVIAVMPEINKYETALLKSDAIGSRVFRRSVFQARRLTFDESLKGYAGTLLVLQAAFDGARVSGCPPWVYEKLVAPVTDGFSAEYVPTAEKLASLKTVTDRILAMGRAALIAETGGAEYDTAFMQEVLATFYDRIFEDFYRRMWLADNSLLAYIKALLDEYASRINPQRFKKLTEKNADLGLPLIFTEREDAAAHTRLTVMADLEKVDDPGAMLRSLYSQTSPLFEVAVKQSVYDMLPDFFKDMPNMRPCPDRTFHLDARRGSYSGRCVDVHSGKYLDFGLIRAVIEAKTLPVLLQTKFARLRTSMKARRELKDKGFVLPEQLGKVDESDK